MYYKVYTSMYVQSITSYMCVLQVPAKEPLFTATIAVTAAAAAAAINSTQPSVTCTTWEYVAAAAAAAIVVSKASKNQAS